MISGAGVGPGSATTSLIGHRVAIHPCGPMGVGMRNSVGTVRKWRMNLALRRSVYHHARIEKDPDMTDRVDPAPATSGRTVLLGAGAIGAAAVGAGVLAACGPATAADSGTGADANKQPIKVADIPVGGGAIYPERVVVVTQPVADQFRAFSA